jgi:hypothetical protein
MSRRSETSGAGINNRDSFRLARTAVKQQRAKHAAGDREGSRTWPKERSIHWASPAPVSIDTAHIV